jgi:hypothetical protein
MRGHKNLKTLVQSDQIGKQAGKSDLLKKFQILYLEFNYRPLVGADAIQPKCAKDKPDFE